ncbi:MAG: helix-turn-helix transcriptional regulator, partial [Lachnospiraceae bacterium]|nr:helix-turn-helix transcriptional regulator [Lachnospiraceae bacterium]
RWPISVGTVFFSFADIPFSFEAGQSLEFYYISFRGSRADELFRRFGITSASCIFEGCEGLLPHWQDNIVRANDENADLLSESLLYYTFSRLKKNTQSGSDLVAFVLSYLDEHFTESTLSLSEVADAAGYHKKYLSSTFKKQFGMGLSEYLRILRIRYAVVLMENGVTSVKNVAALSGFSDPLYFSKVFTDTIGCSPSQYQKNGRQKNETSTIE